MINASASTTSQDKTKQLADRLKELATKKVYVGVPEEKAPRKGSGEISNAQLVFIHTNGSPLRGIPARPIIEPAIEAEDNKTAISAELKEAAKALLDAKPAQVTVHLKRAGIEGMNAARNWFDDPRNNWAPNSPATIRRKGSDKPLIDTAQMRKAITYVVDEEGQ